VYRARLPMAPRSRSAGGCYNAAVKVALFITCLGDVIRPAAGKATVKLLRRLGHEVEFPPEQTCCGQPMYNSGFADLARRLARQTIETFDDKEAVVTPSGSCAAMVKLEFPHLFEDDADWHRRANDLASRTFELSDFLVNQLKVLDVGARFDGSVAYHYACHLRILGLADEAPRLILHVQGARYVPLSRQDVCCGFGGSFAVRYPRISTAMVDDKATCIAAAAADVLVSTDAGCLMNIGGRLRRREQAIEVLHLAELLERR